jgi:hypothetical protein
MGRELLNDLIANSPRSGERALVQQHQSPDRALERHIEQAPQQPRRGALSRNVRRLMTDVAELRWSVALLGRPNPESRSVTPVTRFMS